MDEEWLHELKIDPAVTPAEVYFHLTLPITNS